MTSGLRPSGLVLRTAGRRFLPRACAAMAIRVWRGPAADAPGDIRIATNRTAADTVNPSRLLRCVPASLAILPEIERTGHRIAARVAPKRVIQPGPFGGKRTPEFHFVAVYFAADVAVIRPSLVRSGQIIALCGDHQFVPRRTNLI